MIDAGTRPLDIVNYCVESGADIPTLRTLFAEILNVPFSETKALMFVGHPGYPHDVERDINNMFSWAKKP
ncbi:MAG TPA: hypothetical protein VM490_15965 [Armatimonadaceae bacterium]|nr:hypothetical protein [Armatimonadaceae bacterium]